MPLFLDNRDVEQLLSMKTCMEALEILYRELGEGKAVAAPRSDIHVPTAAGDAAEAPMAHYLKTMSGATPHFGTAALRFSSDIVAWRTAGGLRREKLPTMPGNRWLGIVLLFSSSNGELLAIMNDGVLQRMRVGGANGVATKFLARADASRVGLIGSGWQAGSQVMAVCEARQIKQIKVYSPTRANREKFAAETSGVVNVEIVPVDSQAEAVRDVDIVITSTNAREPFLGPEALGEGMHLSCMQRDEASDAALRRCNPLIVHTHLLENDATSADLRKYDRPGFELKDHPLKRGIDWKSLPTLPDLVVGRTPGRRSDAEITGFVNILGLGAQFAAVGAKVYEAARAQGAGRELPLDWFTQDVHP